MVGVVSPAAAQGSTSAGTAVFDGTTADWSPSELYGRKDIGGTKYFVTPVDGTVGKITYNSTWEVRLTNITDPSATQTDPWALRALGGDAVTGLPVLDTNTNTWNVTFSASGIGATTPAAGKFDQVGNWEVLHNGATFGWLLVNATENLKVTLSQDTFTYASGQVQFRITVTDLTTGAAVSGAAVTINDGITPTLTTNANGIVDYTGASLAAGTYTVRATKNAPAPANNNPPEFEGEAELTIAPAALRSTAVTTDVLRGFDGAVEFNFTYPDGKPVFAINGPGAGLDARTDDYRVNISYPSGCWVVFSGSGGTFSRSAYAVGGANGASSCNDGFNLGLPVITTADGTTKGNVKFEDLNATGWQTGQYAMMVEINSAGAAIGTTGKGVEYTSTASWTPGTPADVNIEIPAGLTDGKIDVQNTQDPNKADATAGLPPSSTVTVKVTGFNKDQHPTGKWNDGCTQGVALCWDDFKTSKNVTLEGDFLTIVDANGNRLAPSIAEIAYSGANAGEFVISNLYPTKGGGKILVHITWKNATYTKEIPIGKGASISADKSELVVDTTDSISFTLRGPSGAADPYGEVRVYRVVDGTTTAAIDTATRYLSGNGNEGLGLDGQYTFNLKESELGTYLVYGKVGQTFSNFTYMTFRVVPAHDLQVSVVKNEATLAGLSTEFAFNVTKANGGAYARSGELPEVFLLNSGELKNFLENGTLPTKFTPSIYPGTGDILSYNVTTTLAPDVYTVYVRDFESKHDNLGSMPTIQGHHATVSFSPSGIMNNTNIQANETLTITVVDWAGQPLNGTLVQDPAGDGRAWFYEAVSADNNVTAGEDKAAEEGAFIKIVNGMATVKATANHLGSIRWEFTPSTVTTRDINAPYPDALGTLEILPPNVEVTPSKIPVGQTSPVVVTVKDLKGAPVRTIPVEICGAPIGGSCTGVKNTDAAGIARVGVTPFATGNLTLRINGTNTPTVVEVFAGLDIVTEPSEPKVGDLVAISVRQPGRTGETDVLVKVLDAAGTVVKEQVTDVTGLVRWTPATEGIYTITGEKVGFEMAEKQVTVSAAVAPPPADVPKFALSDLGASPSRVTVGDSVTVTVGIANSGTADGSASLRLKVNGATFDVKEVPVAAGESDTVAFTFTPTQAGDFRVSVSLVGGSELGPTVVTAAARQTTPPVEPDPVNPSGVPGFEALFALAALGVAFVLVRRKL